MKKTNKKAMGSLTARLAALLVAFACAGTAQGLHFSTVRANIPLIYFSSYM